MIDIGFAELVVDWRLDPSAAVVTLLVVLAYVRGVLRLRDRGRAWPVVRSVAFAISIISLVFATQSGIGRYDTERLTVHMIQHLLLGMVVPFAFVASAPLTLALQSGRPGTRLLLRRALRHPTARVISHPVVTWVIFGGGLVLIYFTPLLEVSARNDVVHLLVHAHLMLAGSLFLTGLVGADVLPHPLGHGARLLVALTAVPFHAFLALAMLSATTPLAPEAYPMLTDQRAAAGLLWGMGEIFTLAVAAVVVRRWYLADLREGARLDRRHEAVGGGA